MENRQAANGKNLEFTFMSECLKKYQMKSTIKYLLIVVLGLVFGVSAYAQSQPSDRLPIADKNSFKGRRELKKERKVKVRMDKHNKKNARKAIKASKASKYTVGKSRKIRLRKTKSKENKTSVVEPKEKAK